MRALDTSTIRALGVNRLESSDGRRIRGCTCRPRSLALSDAANHLTCWGGQDKFGSVLR
jgi:hypothetical protein